MKQTPSYGDLVEPQAIRFSFHTPGWYVLGALCCVLLLIVIYFALRHYHRNRYRHHAVQWLGKQTATLSPQHQWYAAGQLLKQLAMQVYGAPRVASLQGDAWIHFLNQSIQRPGYFSAADGRLLREVLYKDVPAAPAPFMAKTKYWILHHRYAYRDRV